MTGQMLKEFDAAKRLGVASLALLTAVVCCGPSVARANDNSRHQLDRKLDPSDLNVTLMQKRLAAARLRDDKEQVERLENRLRTLLSERRRLKRSTYGGEM